MYLRHSTVRKDGKTHTYWRGGASGGGEGRGRGPQEAGAVGGGLEAEGRLRARSLARHLTGRGDQFDLFEDGTSPKETVAIRLDGVRVERQRRFGDVWLCWTLWRALELDILCARLMPEGREEVRWSAVAAVLVIARVCEPSSELHIAEDWYRGTALEDVLGITSERINDDRLYRGLDKLLTHKTAIAEHLRKRLGDLFPLEY